MGFYETTYILHSALQEGRLNDIINIIEKKTQSIGAEILYSDNWGRKKLSYLIYIIVVWGFTQAPIPMVAALRESSIFFSIFIGYFFLKERITTVKIISIILIVLGVIGLKLV